jgi:hypothetical protein
LCNHLDRFHLKSTIQIQSKTQIWTKTTNFKTKLKIFCLRRVCL